MYSFILVIMYFQIRRQLIYHPKLNIGTVLRNSSLLVCNSHRNLQEQYGHVPPHWAETMQISSHHPEQTFSTRGRSTLAQYLPSPQWPSCIQNVYFLNVRNHFRIHQCAQKMAYIKSVLPGCNWYIGHQSRYSNILHCVRILTHLTTMSYIALLATQKL